METGKYRLSFLFILIFLLTNVLFSQDLIKISPEDNVRIKIKEKYVQSDVIISLKGDTNYTHKIVEEKYFSRVNGKKLRYKIERDGIYVDFNVPEKTNKTIELEYLENGIKEVLTVEAGDSVIYEVNANCSWSLNPNFSIDYFAGSTRKYYTPPITAIHNGTDLLEDVYRIRNKIVIKFTAGKYPVKIDPTIYLTYYDDHCTYVDEANPNDNYGGYNYQWSRIYNEIRRNLLIKVNVPERTIKLDSSTIGAFYENGDADSTEAAWYLMWSNRNFAYNEATYNNYRTSPADSAWTNAGGDYHTSISSDTILKANGGYNEWLYWDFTNVARSIIEDDSINAAMLVCVGGDGGLRLKVCWGVRFYYYYTDIGGADTFSVSAADTNAFQIYLGTGFGDEYVNLSVKIDSTIFWLDSLGNSDTQKSNHYLFDNVVFDSTIIRPNMPVTFRAQRDSTIYESDWDTLVVHSQVDDVDSLTLLGYDNDYIYLQFKKDANPDTTEYLIYDEYQNVYYDSYGNDSVNAVWEKKESFQENDTIRIKHITGEYIYRFKVKAKNENGMETSYSEVKEVVTFGNLVKPMKPGVEALNDSQFRLTVIDTTNDFYEGTTYALHDSNNSIYFDSLGNKIDTALYLPKISWEGGIIASGYSPNDSIAFYNIAQDSLKYNLLYSDDSLKFSLTRPGSINALSENDSTITVIFNYDENPEETKYVLFDSAGGNYFNLQGDSFKSAVKFIKSNFDTIEIKSSYPNKRFELFTGSFNSDSAFSGYSEKTEIYSQVLVPEIDSIKVLNKDSVFVKLSVPEENPDYSLYCLEDSASGDLYNLNTKRFEPASGYPQWCWGTLNEFGSDGFYILTDAVRRYVIRLYAKEGTDK